MEIQIVFRRLFVSLWHWLLLSVVVHKCVSFFLKLFNGNACCNQKKKNKTKQLQIVLEFVLKYIITFNCVNSKSIKKIVGTRRDVCKTSTNIADFSTYLSSICSFIILYWIRWKMLLVYIKQNINCCRRSFIKQLIILFRLRSGGV